MPSVKTEILLEHQASTQLPLIYLNGLPLYAQEQLLNSTSLGLMFQKQSDRYGYGWLVGERLERPVIRGDGWDGVGYAAHMIFFKNEELVVIVLCNLNISTITSEIAIQLSAVALNESLPQPSIQILPIPKETVKEVAGLYRFGKDFYVPDATIRIIEKNGTLMELQEPSGNLVGLLSTGNLEFLHRSHWFRMVFEKDTRGKIKGMKYDNFYAEKISE